jgi:hypothetical protein
MFRRLVTYGEESVYGEPAPSPDRAFGWVTEFSGGAEVVAEPVALAWGARQKRIITYGVDVSPSITFLPTGGSFFKYALGQVSNTGAEPPYTHEITVAPSLRLPSITILEHRIGEQSHGFRYSGCLVESFEASWEADGPLECTAEFAARRMELVSQLPQAPQQLGQPYKASHAQIILDGQSYPLAAGGSISLSNNHVALPRGADGYVQGHVASSIDIEASLRIYYTSPDLVALMLGGEVFEVQIRFVRAEGDTLEFRLLGCVASVEAPLSAEDTPVQEVSLKAEDIKIVAVDGQPSY